LTPVTLGQAFGSNAPVTLTGSQLPEHDHGLQGGGTTGITGGAGLIGNVQASLGLNYVIALQGAFPSRDTAFDPELEYYGEVALLATNTIPNGWHLADGSLLSINQNQALFSILGTTYGGDGHNFFALPDLRGRAVIGSSGIYQSGTLPGDKFGNESFGIDVSNLPSHTHDYTLTGGVPEPASWAMLIAGFGLSGAALRRRRGLQAVSA
jgi:microcystin-dependent protein